MIYLKSIDNEIVGSNDFTIIVQSDGYTYDIICKDIVLASFDNMRDASETVNRIWYHIERGNTTINMEGLV